MHPNVHGSTIYNNQDMETTYAQWFSRLFATTWTADCQAPLSMRFFRQEYCSGSHYLFQGIFTTQGSIWHLLYLLHCKWILYHQGSQ